MISGICCKILEMGELGGGSEKTGFPASWRFLGTGDGTWYFMILFCLLCDGLKFSII